MNVIRHPAVGVQACLQQVFPRVPVSAGKKDSLATVTPQNDMIEATRYVTLGLRGIALCSRNEAQGTTDIAHHGAMAKAPYPGQ